MRVLMFAAGLLALLHTRAFAGDCAVQEKAAATARAALSGYLEVSRPWETDKAISPQLSKAYEALDHALIDVARNAPLPERTKAAAAELAWLACRHKALRAFATPTRDRLAAFVAEGERLRGREERVVALDVPAAGVRALILEAEVYDQTVQRMAPYMRDQPNDADRLISDDATASRVGELQRAVHFQGDRTDAELATAIGEACKRLAALDAGAARAEARCH